MLHTLDVGSPVQLEGWSEIAAAQLYASHVTVIGRS